MIVKKHGDTPAMASSESPTLPETPCRTSTILTGSHRTAWCETEEMVETMRRIFMMLGEDMRYGRLMYADDAPSVYEDVGYDVDAEVRHP